MTTSPELKTSNAKPWGALPMKPGCQFRARDRRRRAAPAAEPSAPFAAGVHRKQELGESRVAGQLRVKCDGQDSVLPDRHRVLVDPPQHLHRGPVLRHPWSTDEHRMDGAAGDPLEL